MTVDRTDCASSMFIDTTIEMITIRHYSSIRQSYYITIVVVYT